MRRCRSQAAARQQGSPLDAVDRRRPTGGGGRAAPDRAPCNQIQIRRKNVIASGAGQRRFGALRRPLSATRGSSSTARRHSAAQRPGCPRPAWRRHDRHQEADAPMSDGARNRVADLLPRSRSRGSAEATGAAKLRRRPHVGRREALTHAERRQRPWAALLDASGVERPAPVQPQINGEVCAVGAQRRNLVPSGVVDALPPRPPVQVVEPAAVRKPLRHRGPRLRGRGRGGGRHEARGPAADREAYHSAAALRQPKLPGVHHGEVDVEALLAEDIGSVQPRL